MEGRNELHLQAAELAFENADVLSPRQIEVPWTTGAVEWRGVGRASPYRPLKYTGSRWREWFSSTQARARCPISVRSSEFFTRSTSAATRPSRSSGSRKN